MRLGSRELSVGVVLFVLLLALAMFAPNFYEMRPLASRVASQMPVLVLAIGVAMVIITKQIDISVGSQFGMCAVVCGVVAGSGMPVGVAMLAALVAGAVMGGLNGWLVAYVRLPSIVVTLATMVMWQEVLRLWQKGRMLDLPAGVQWFGMSQGTGQGVVIACAMAFMILAAWMMRNVSLGRRIHAVGSNEEAARLAGINPQRVIFGSFLVMGMLAGIAAILNLVQSPQIQPNCGDGMELKAIAAAVVGGVAISGGRGTMPGVLLGMMLLVNVNPALTHFHLPPYWEKAIQGFVILVAVGLDGWKRKEART